MRFCSFQVSRRRRFGFELPDGRVVDLRQASLALASGGDVEMPAGLTESADLKSWLSGGEQALETARQVRDRINAGSDLADLAVYKVPEVRLLAPVPNPGKIIAIGLNYRDHAEEQGAQLPERPLLFAKFPTAVAGPEDEIRLPAISRQVDPEGELCIVMGQSGRGFSERKARQAIAGYTIGNDVSARDLQFGDRQWVRGKSCDTFAPLGPALVTEDELGDPHDLDIELLVNGEVRQSSNTRNLIFNCYQLVAHISEAITLETGDVIFTGTPAGVGVFRDPPVFLKEGDLVEITIERIGTLRNRVAEQSRESV